MLIIKNPPWILESQQYKKKVNEIENRILESVNAMFNTGNTSNDAFKQ